MANLAEEQDILQLKCDVNCTPEGTSSESDSCFIKGIFEKFFSHFEVFKENSNIS